MTGKRLEMRKLIRFFLRFIRVTIAKNYSTKSKLCIIHQESTSSLFDKSFSTMLLNSSSMDFSSYI